MMQDLHMDTDDQQTNIIMVIEVSKYICCHYDADLNWKIKDID
jgi:hypothetical protein